VKKLNIKTPRQWKAHDQVEAWRWHMVVQSATGGKAAEESSFKKLGPRQWGAKAGVQKLGPDVVN
jgi:hypothetical protein